MPSLSIGSFNAGGFIVNMGSSYLLSRLSARDGPRLGNLKAGDGDFGVPMPRLYGAAVRISGITVAQADIKETTHKVEDYSEIVGAVTGAVQGFMIGGPVGAVVGGVLGGLFGAATPDQKYYTYSDSFMLLLADRHGEAPIEGVTRVWAAGKLLFDAAESAVVAETLEAGGGLVRRQYGKNRFFKSLTIYGGSGAQGVDPVMAAAVGETSGHPFSALAVFEDLQLADFGNAVPQIDLLVEVAGGETLAGVAEKMCAAAGIDPVRALSTSQLAGDAVRGYALTAEASCWDALEPLLPVFGRDAAEVGGQLRFFRRSQALRATLPADVLGAHAFGEDPPPAIRFERAGDIALPRETSVTFLDPGRDYQANTASSSRSEGEARSNVTVNLPLVLLAGEGGAAAATIHWDAWLGRTAARFTLDDGWSAIEVGRAYAVPFAGETLALRVTRRTRGANGLIEVEAVSDEAVAYSAVVDATSGTLPGQDSTLFAETRLLLLDMPILDDGWDDAGFIVVMGAGAAYWPRARIQGSSEGAPFATLIDSPLSCPAMGTVATALPAGPTDGLDDSLDMDSVLEVELLHDSMTLASASDAELDDHRNFAFVGSGAQGEYLQFKFAAKIGFRTWQLTGLRRGRRGTDWAMAGHGAGEDFALLGGDGVFHVVVTDPAQWGEAMSFRGVTLHQDEDDAAVVPFVNSGEGKRPLSPGRVTGSWNGAGDATIAWTERPRRFDGAPGIDDRDEFDVELTSGSGTARLVVGATATVFTAAEQSALGIVPGDNLAGRVRQRSDVHHGRWRDFALVGPNALLTMEDGFTPLELEDGATPMEME